MKKLIRTTMAAFVLLAAGAAGAGDITESQARTVAESFVTKDGIGLSVLSGRTIDAVSQRGGLWLVTLKPSGYVFVSANRAAEPVPAFSENNFTEPEAGSPQAAFLALAESNSVYATGAKYEKQWRTMLGERTLRQMAAGVKAPTTRTTRLPRCWGFTLIRSRVQWR